MTLDDIARLIRQSRSPKELFEKTSHRDILMACHPDRNPGEPRAEALFKQVQDLHKQSEQPPVVVKSPQRKYTLLKTIAAGDVSDVFLAESDGKDYVFKISRVPEGRGLLQAEGVTLKTLNAKADGLTYRHYLPTLVESFPANTRFVNVFEHQGGFHTLEEVHEKYPKGVEPGHLGWIFNRLLTVLGFARLHNFVHGAVLPNHVLLHTEDHGLRLVGWGQGVTPGNKVLFASTKYRNWYAPEVVRKLPASPETDIYHAVKCLLYVSGGDPVNNCWPYVVPKQMRHFFNSCLLEGAGLRPGDAWALMEEYRELLLNTFGTPKFLSLPM